MYVNCMLMIPKSTHEIIIDNLRKRKKDHQKLVVLSRLLLALLGCLTVCTVYWTP